jgi:hypothetical protein
LSKKFETSKAAHKEDNKKIMENNMDLIEQITELRQEVTKLNEQFMSRGGKMIIYLRDEEQKRYKLTQEDRDKDERMRKHRELFAQNDMGGNRPESNQFDNEMGDDQMSEGENNM